MIPRPRFGAACVALCLLVSACSNSNNNVLQGWIEGDFIFVSPDEQGRIEQMLVRQGAIAFTHWTGIEPPVDVMRKAVQEVLSVKP